MKKQVAKYDLSIHCKIRVQGNDKCDIRANLNQIFIDREWFPSECPIRLYGDNKASIHIAFHERTKHIEVDCHIVHKKLEDKIVVAKHVSTGHQLADFLTKPLGKIMVDFIYDKLDKYYVYAPA